MPITRRQFQLAIDRRIEQWMRKIHAFLAEHNDMAFSVAELKGELNPSPPWLQGLSAKELREGVHRRHLPFFDQFQEEERYLEDDRAIDIAIEKLAQLRATEERVVSGISYYVYRGPLVLGDSEKKPPF